MRCCKLKLNKLQLFTSMSDLPLEIGRIYWTGFLATNSNIGVKISMRPALTKDLAPTSRMLATLAVPLGAMYMVSRAPTMTWVANRPMVVILKSLMEQHPLFSSGLYLAMINRNFFFFN